MTDDIEDAPGNDGDDHLDPEIAALKPADPKTIPADEIDEPG